MAHILVVDDEDSHRKLVMKMLVSAGHTVTEAEHGEAALAAMQQGLPDVIVTDILMPNKGGLALIRDIRTRYPRQKIIAISGGGEHGKLSFLSTARSFTGVRTLQKPFSKSDLSLLVGEMLSASYDHEC